MTYEKHYYTRGQNASSKEEIKKINGAVGKLDGLSNETEETGSGRKYDLKNGSVEYRIGNEPRLTIQSETKEGLEKTIKELNL